MEFEHDQEQESLYVPANDTPRTCEIPTQKPKKKGSFWKIFFIIAFLLSVLANFFLFVLLIAASMFVSVGHTSSFIEDVIRDGSSSKKIAVIRLEGIIDSRLSDLVKEQLDSAAKDESVKAVILRVISPGGGVAASDRIHHQISKFRNDTNKPVVSFMQTVAASGGYYASVACDKIISEPTTITGSIGVMANHMVFKQLLEEKLGITPVVVKSGEKKDWPSIFSETTEEQKEYLQQKLIIPAYDRFVALVADGRKDLSLQEVITLADGSIYGAPEAYNNKLIDELGFIEDAIAMTEKLAHIKNAKVFEYTQPFTLSSVLGAQSETIFNFDRKMIEKLATPQLMYLWDGK
ncbi:MAG: signal peptide peptidase SppA [Planctomycetes bacterium]|nr:signal peptide peptidase SppA [Planctomycetota bacterium]